jgi:diguanylate cyclase (GGDEF)-like protein
MNLLSSPGETTPIESRTSLVQAMRIGGFTLILAFLSIIASYLVIQKVWIEKGTATFSVVDRLSYGLMDARAAFGDEILALRAPVVDRAAIDAARMYVDGHSADVEECIRILQRDEPEAGDRLQPDWTKFRSALAELRRMPNDAAATELDRSIAKVRETLSAVAGDYRNCVKACNDRFEFLVGIRTLVLIVVAVAGGLATFMATAYTIRRTRRSLKNIVRHVGAIENGELEPRDMETFAEIAEVNARLNRLASTLDQSRLEARQEHLAALARQQELEFANNLVLEFSRARSEKELIAVFQRRAAELFHSEKIEILRLVSPHGFLEEIDGLAGPDWKPRIVENPDTCHAFRAHGAAVGTDGLSTCAAASDRSMVVYCIPMVTLTGVVGAVHIMLRSGEALSPSRIELAGTLVRLFTPALENARLLRESIERSATDSLTGLANRRRLEEFGTKAVALAVRQGAPLSVIALDLDKFKEINDEFGHDAGDRALQAVARAMQQSIRETDLAARIGGDEFAILLPCSNATMAVHVIERVRQNLRNPQTRNLPFALHLSAGIAELSPQAQTLPDMLAVADRALYEAKRQARGEQFGRLAEGAVEDSL